MRKIQAVDLPYREDPTEFFEAIRDLPGAVWLDSGKPRSFQGRFDILSACPSRYLETRGDTTRVASSDGPTDNSADDPIDLARALQKEMGILPEDSIDLPFAGGLIGFFSYDLGLRFNGLRSNDTRALPDMRLGWYGWALVVNHHARTATLLFHPACSPPLKRDINRRFTAPLPQPASTRFHLRRPFSPSVTRAQYLGALDAIRDYIHSGDCYQVNYAQAFETRFGGDTWTAYRALRYALPSPYSAYMAWDDKALLSLSPERFLKVSRGGVETKPIKGTVARGRTLAEDNDNARRLLNSAKDRAENLMIVDLLRNDLGKNCQTGSIRVPRLFSLESFANVHHLVSTVTGRLNDGADALALLRDCLPGGSITGAPKRRAMEIIAELEPAPREIYCGSIGYVSAHGRMDTNIAIRTIAAQGDRLRCWGGGGIVADSDPQEEYRESLQKVRVLMSTLERL